MSNKINDELKGTQSLTTEKLRTYPGFENTSDADAEEAIHAIRNCVRVFYDLYISNLKRNEE